MDSKYLLVIITLLTSIASFTLPLSKRMISSNTKKHLTSNGVLKKKHSEDSFTSITWRSFKNIIQMKPKPIKWVSTNLLLLLMLNSKLNIWDKERTKIFMTQQVTEMKLLVTLIGLLKEKFLQLRIKEIVDHAGLLVLSEFYNHGLYSMEKL